MLIYKTVGAGGKKQKADRLIPVKNRKKLTKVKLSLFINYLVGGKFD